MNLKQKIDRLIADTGGSMQELAQARKEAAAWKKAYNELLTWVKNPPHPVCVICGEHAFFEISKRCEDHPPR